MGGSGDSCGDRSGDSCGAALGVHAGKGAPRPASLISPLPPSGSRFWALSQSEAGSNDDELASVEDLVPSPVPGEGAGRAPVTLGPFIDRALGSPGWTRAGRGSHGHCRATGAGPAAAAPPSPSSVSNLDPDPVGSMDLADFPPLSSLPVPAVVAAVHGRAALLQVGEFVFPAGPSTRPAVLGFPAASAAVVASGRSSPPLADGSQVSGSHVASDAPSGVQAQVEKVVPGPPGPSAHFPRKRNSWPKRAQLLKWFWRPNGTLDCSHFFPTPISDLRSSGGGAQIHLPPLSPSAAPPPSTMDRYWRDVRDGRGSYKRPFAVVAQSDHRPIQDYSEEELREILEACSLDSDRRRERLRERSPVRQPEPYHRGVAERYPVRGQANYYRRNYSGGGDGSGPSNVANKKQKPSPTPLATAAPSSSAPPLSAGGSSQADLGEGEPQAPKPKNICYNCSRGGHQSVCTFPAHCALCDVDGHTSAMCPRNSKSPELKHYGIAADGVGFFALDGVPPL
jgi:hypothetical protein